MINRWSTRFIALFVFAMALSAVAQSRLEVIEFSSRILKDNPLHDPAKRRVAVFVPGDYAADHPLPVVYYLPGFGGSSESFIRKPDPWLKFSDKLALDGVPVIFAVVDGRTHWQCSQYINSPGQGRYADYICDEIVQRVEERYPAPSRPIRRIIAGHSSGGFGALRLGLMRPSLFDGVVALSPDSDFPVSHLPLVLLPGVTNETPAQIDGIMKAAPSGARLPKDGDLIYALALSAAYAPAGPGEFEWLFDAQHRLRRDVWQRWLGNDPLTIVEKNSDAFRAGQSVYLEGAAKDEYKANIGARAIYEVVKHGRERVTFYEPPGHHGSHVPERIERGIQWVLGKKPLHIER